MSLIRPEAAAALKRWREVALSLALVAVGLWIFFRSGVFYGAIGGTIMGLGVGLALSAWRRVRFGQPPTGAGLVEVVEGQVSYFGPETGGLIALSELERVAIAPHGDSRAWRMIQSEGAALSIPVAAKGADALFDVFCALPGAKTETFLAAQSGPLPQTEKILWRRASSHRPIPIGRS